MDSSNIILFIISSSLLSIAPGPDNLFVLNQSIQYSKKTAFIILFGLCTGLVFHTLLVATGLAIIILANEYLFQAIKVLGSFYMLYLAWGSWNNKNSNLEISLVQRTNFQLYLKGVFLSSLNPKLLIFFMAFFPKFINPDSQNIFQSTMMYGSIFIVCAILIFSIYIFIGSLIKKLFSQYQHLNMILNRITSIVFISMALSIFILEQ